MNRTSIFAALLAAATLGAACKKDQASDGAPSGSASAVANQAASGSASPGASATPPPTPAPGEGVRLTKKAPVVGTKMSDDFKSAMSLKITMAKKSIDVAEDESRTMDEEILEVAGNAVTKMKVTFSNDQKSSSQDGKPATATNSAVAGKTYVLAFKDGKTAVLNDKEKPAPAAEAKLVQKHFTSFGKADPVFDALPDRAFKPGEAVVELTEAVTKQLKGTDEKVSVEGVQVTFKGREGDRAVFNLAVTMKTGGPFKMTMPLTGSFSMRVADGMPTGISLAGPINLDLTDKDKGQGVGGQGTVKIADTFTFK